MVITHQVKQGSPQWHALREPLITASNAYTLLTKGRNAAANKPAGAQSGFWGERGHILEDEAISIYESVYGVSVSRPGFLTNTDYPGCGYSPDGFDGDIPLEVKCFKEEKHLLCLDDTPIEVFSQIQFGEMIAEAQSGRLLLYNPDVEDSALCFRVIEIPRDDMFIDRLKAKLSPVKPMSPVIGPDEVARFRHPEAQGDDSSI